jgi:hypothetical protein
VSVHLQGERTNGVGWCGAKASTKTRVVGCLNLVTCEACLEAHKLRTRGVADVLASFFDPKGGWGDGR